MKKYDDLINDLRNLSTEQVNQNSIEIDKKSAREIVTIINREDKTVAGVVEKQLDSIAQAAELYAETLKKGGRVFYIGAGTSGRLGVLDAAECPPTFGTDPNQIIGVISGGYDTLVLSQEGVEDQTDAAVEDLNKHQLGKDDLLIGLAASRRTPYTVAGLEYAHKTGCKTIFIICNKWNQTKAPITPDIVIELEVGPEVITGSTRMKSGTAQKMTLNLISTTAMVLLGKTYGNLMVDLQARSEKLAARSRKMLIDLLKISLEDAEKLLSAADGSVKVALVMGLINCDKKNAELKLSSADGFIRKTK